MTERNMKTLWQAGFHIQVTSWENDGDNYRMSCLRADSREEAELAFELAQLFTSMNDSKNPGLGNSSHPGEIDIEGPLEEFAEKWKAVLDVDLGVEADTDKRISQLKKIASSLYLLDEYGEDFYTRVCEKAEVLEFEQDVVYVSVKEYNR